MYAERDKAGPSEQIAGGATGGLGSKQVGQCPRE